MDTATEDALNDRWAGFPDDNLTVEQRLERIESVLLRVEILANRQEKLLKNAEELFTEVAEEVKTKGIMGLLMKMRG